MINSKNKYFILIVIGVFAIAFASYKLAVSNKSINSSNANIDKNNLVKEFNNSYPQEIESSGNIIEYDIVAAPTQLNLLNDNKMAVWAYNNQVPGPVLRLKLGDTLRVNFKNNLPQGTSIHWHGVRVPNDMDGVPGLTQDLILPGESFVYEFTPKDAGTFWFHPHNRTSEQIEKGLYGVLIVDEREEEDYSQDLTLVLDDWRLSKDGQIDPNFNTISDFMHDGRWGNVLTTNSQTSYELAVSRGERIRLRLINVANARIYRLNLSGFETNVIAIDGMKVGTNFRLQDLDLSPGNRVDLDIKVPADFKRDKLSLMDTFTRNNYNLVNFKIGKTVVATPDFVLAKNENMPQWLDAHKLEADVVLNLNARREGAQIKWTINDRAYPDFEKISLQANTFNKILLNNQSSRLHPMHLHGQFFKVLSRNGQPVDENYWRDAVLLGPKESVEIGLVPLDKGLWANHCHALEHAEAGMLTVIEVI